MLDDSLKSTRSIHRLLISASFVTFLFAISLEPPEDLIVQRDYVSELLEVDFYEYEKYIEQRILEFDSVHLLPAANQISEALKARNFFVNNVNNLGEVFSYSPHISKVSVDSLAVSDIAGSTLSQLDALNKLNIDLDVQIVVPKIDDLPQLLMQFLDTYDAMGSQVSLLTLGLEDHSIAAHSFLESKEQLLSLYFQITGPYNMGGAPEFYQELKAEVMTIPNTSFKSWLLLKKKTDLFAEDGKRLVFLPKLNIPEISGIRDMRMKELIARIDAEKERIGRPGDSQTIKIVGISVPGVLIVFASPLLLFSLIYYLYNHVHHISLTVEEHFEEIKQFSWSPISVRKTWRFDSLSSIIALPVVAILVLFYQYTQFDTVSVWPSIVLGVCFMGLLITGVMIFNKIRFIRQVIFETPVVEEEELATAGEEESVIESEEELS